MKKIPSSVQDTILNELKNLEAITKEIARTFKSKLEKIKFPITEYLRENKADAERVLQDIDFERLKPVAKKVLTQGSILAGAGLLGKNLAEGMQEFGFDTSSQAPNVVQQAPGSTQTTSAVENIPSQQPKTITGRIASSVRNFFSPQKSPQKSQQPFQKISNIKPIGMTGSAKEALDFFKSKGWSPEQAAGIVGNLQTESNLKTDALGDGGEAYGIAQWHPDRQENFRKWRNKDIRESTFKEQLEFVQYELVQGEEHRAGDKIKQTKTAEDAAAFVDEYYERSQGTEDPAKIGGIHVEERIANAIALLNGENAIPVNEVADQGKIISDSTSAKRKGSVTNNIITQQIINTDSGSVAGDASLTSPMPNPESVKRDYERI
jgi:hypothetical protein